MGVTRREAGLRGEALLLPYVKYTHTQKQQMSVIWTMPKLKDKRKKTMLHNQLCNKIVIFTIRGRWGGGMYLLRGSKRLAVGLRGLRD